MKKVILIFIFIFMSLSIYAVETKKDNIHMFPKVKVGFVRHVIEVPPTYNDGDHLVELLIGKMVLVDCNHYSFLGKVESVTLKGWGYKYIEVNSIKNGPTTRMACKKPKTKRYISIRDKLRRYNSRSPIVVYVPKEYEVRYRIWSASQEIDKAQSR